MKNSKYILVASLEIQDVINLPYPLILIFLVLHSYSFSFLLKFILIDKMACVYGTQHVLLYVSKFEKRSQANQHILPHTLVICFDGEVYSQ